MDDFANRVQKVDADGKARFGEANWNQMMDAIKAQTNGGVPVDVMKNVLAQPDPTRLLADGGKEALLSLSDSGDHEAEKTYRVIRQKEREDYRKGRGR